MQLNILLAPSGALVRQITIRTMMVSVVSFSVFFGVARQILLERPHNGLMVLALGLLGITAVGLIVALYSAVSNRNASQVDT